MAGLHRGLDCWRPLVTATTTSILNNTITSNKSFATTTGTNTMKYMTHPPNSNERNGGASHMDNLQSKCLQKNLMMSFRMQQFSSSLPRGDIVVKHLQESKTFTIEFDGHPAAYLKYRHIDRSSVDLFTTVVPTSLEGHGIAKHLANAAFDFARREKLKIKPSCWYIAGYLKRHPQNDLEIL